MIRISRTCTYRWSLCAAVVAVAIGVAMGAASPHARAQQAQSTTYQVNEVFFGSGGSLESCSGAYCAKQSAGELTVGNTKSNAYQAQAGFNTNREESLELTIVTPAVDLGALDIAQPKTATAQFSVRSYLSSGYAVQTVGAPPTYNSRTLASMSGSASAPGTEQFGLNLVANTSPSAGANPSQDPDASFSFGQAATGYNTANTFRYQSGDIIASSSSSSGKTLYTITYIANTASTTPAGYYTMQQSLVATATY